VDLAQSRVFGFEALLRWQHPVLGFVPPGEFIPLVEMTDLVNPMTLWVLENAIAQAKQWQQQGYRFSVAANLSAQNLLGDALVDKLEELLSQYQLPAELLELEITESTIMADPDRALRVLKAIDGLGVTLAIDDFGTGYSSLAYLKRLPVRLLKIDGSFVTGMLGDDQDQIIVHSTINLAHNLGLKVVAEGVEDEKVLCKLQELGCDQVQGYHIARPQPAPALEQWLRHAQWDS
jgi:EAL domain-containing protein (putative c-di-GMP-specific phosphodiesterase class I)